jgi:actin-related protein 5
MNEFAGDAVVWSTAGFQKSQVKEDQRRPADSMDIPLLPFPLEPSTLTYPEPPPLNYPPAGVAPRTPLVIDFGSHEIKAGWAGARDPTLSFRSLTCKARDGSGDMVTIAGNQVLCKDITKNSVRSPFEKDVIQHFESAEVLLDYTLHRLGINTEAVHHPIFITEALCNPNACRALTSEMLFECYGAPAVAYGVDGLLAYDFNASGAAGDVCAPWTSPAAHGLSVHLGHSCCYVIPIFDGRAHLQHSYRLALGGLSCTSLMSQILPLRFPLHRQAFSLARAQQIKENHCYCAEGNYGEELRKFEALSTCVDKLV